MIKSLVKSYSAWSFVVFIICLILSIYVAYSSLANTWEISPSTYILLLFSIVGFILSVLALNRATKKWQLFRAWLSLTLTATLVILLIVFLLLLSVAESLG